MSFYKRLVSLIAEKNLTFRKVERDCGLANGTIRRWETQSPRLDSVVTVANYLQTSLDYLTMGHSACATHCDSSPLTNEEAELIAMFRFLPSYAQEDLFDQVHCLYEKYVKR